MKLGSCARMGLRDALVSVARLGVDAFSRLRIADYTCICGGRLRPLIQRGRESRKYYRWKAATIHRCDTCGHIQFAPLPSRDWLAEFYKRSAFWEESAHSPTAYISQWLDDLPHRKFVQLVERFADQFSDPTKIHDFACGYGGLVKHLSGPRRDVTGCDMSRACIAWGRRRLGLPITTGGIEHLATIPPQHVITCYHAAEHFLNPDEFFAAASKALLPGGILALAVPNGAFAPAATDYFGRYDWVIYPAHLHYFTPRSIRAALQKNDLEVIHMESISDHEPGLQLDWVHETCPDMTLAVMDQNLLSRDLRVVARKLTAPTQR